MKLRALGQMTDNEIKMAIKLFNEVLTNPDTDRLTWDMLDLLLSDGEQVDDDSTEAEPTPVKWYHVQSSDNSQYYHVREFLDGSRDCNCKGYQYRKTCRHLEEVNV